MNITPKKSWRTTTAGVLALVASAIPLAIALVDGDPATVVDMNEVGVLIMGAFTALGFNQARDKNVSSEEQLAKPKDG